MRAELCPPGNIDDARAIWHRGCGGSGFFLGEAWVSTWLETAGVEAHRLLVREPAGDVAGLGYMVMSHERRLGGLVRARRWNLNTTGIPAKDSIFSEYNGLIGVDELTDEHVAAVLEAMDGTPGWDEWLLHALPESAARLVCQRWPRHRIVWEAPTYRIDLEAQRSSGKDYLAGLSKNSRQQLRRSIRLYEERGSLEIHAADDTRQALEYFMAMKVLHVQAWQQRGHDAGAFRFDAFERFHTRLIERFHQSGHVEVLKVSAGGHVLGYLYNLLRAGHVHSYQSGFALEADNRMKPGLVCHYLAIERHLRQGAKIYDLLAGGQRYKTSLAKPGPALQSVLLWRPRPALLLESWLRSGRQTALRAGSTAARSWKAMVRAKMGASA